ncbi:Oidioi.mRNA.OKI2018_I69.chr2.g7931.t1.cds [Oikopleura dioica]|uniref:Oidioi.mRNA.OKI2018_I69.chr2.g7931.t1.cds n=1 Tax=Oikopleura dioica TaxID=34765 RepID=A0ABN7T7P9_OIKDI|nr:Oidioi.mRNA.OKI2018_I69.chr2.g7931.t1.cds [Oikopleura dioica]
MGCVCCKEDAASDTSSLLGNENTETATSSRPISMRTDPLADLDEAELCGTPTVNSRLAKEDEELMRATCEALINPHPEILDPVQCNERIRQYSHSIHEIFSNIAVERPRESLSSQTTNSNVTLPEPDPAILQQTENLAEELANIFEAAGGFSNVQFTF